MVASVECVPSSVRVQAIREYFRQETRRRSSEPLQSVTKSYDRKSCRLVAKAIVVHWYPKLLNLNFGELVNCFNLLEREEFEDAPETRLQASEI